jgi:antitoxin ParD1/3/4
MRATRQLSITLPTAMVDMVKQQVASGAYASESEVIREGLRSLQERNEAIERWLREEVVPTYDELMGDPSKALTADEVFGPIEARYRAAKARGE